MKRLIHIIIYMTLTLAARGQVQVSGRVTDRQNKPVSNADFNRLQELFRFSGIPHYETITPDCRRVRDDLRINGFYNFDYDLKNVKEKLK